MDGLGCARARARRRNGKGCTDTQTCPVEFVKERETLRPHGRARPHIDLHSRPCSPLREFHIWFVYGLRRLSPSSTRLGPAVRPSLLPPRERARARTPARPLLPCCCAAASEPLRGARLTARNVYICQCLSVVCCFFSLSLSLSLARARSPGGGEGRESASTHPTPTHHASRTNNRTNELTWQGKARHPWLDWVGRRSSSSSSMRRRRRRRREALPLPLPPPPSRNTVGRRLSPVVPVSPTLHPTHSPPPPPPPGCVAVERTQYPCRRVLVPLFFPRRSGRTMGSMPGPPFPPSHRSFSLVFFFFFPPFFPSTVSCRSPVSFRTAGPMVFAGFEEKANNIKCGPIKGSAIG